jgi:transcriptional regulator with XRE-family HTH domain
MSSTTAPTWTIGDRIRKARRAAGIDSTGDMADLVGVSRNTITNWEADRTQPNVMALRAIAAATGVSVTWLIGGDDPDLRSRCFSTEIDQLELFANTAAVAA